MKIYVDNAATTKMSRHAKEVLNENLDLYFANPNSLHLEGQKAQEVLDSSREMVASCLNASPREIIFTSGGSESDNQALMTAYEIGLKTGKNHIITSRIEHHAILHTLDALKKKGVEVTYLDVDDKGFINLEDLENAITDKTVMVSIMYANNEIGTIEPVREIGEICHKHKVLFHTDAVQAVGHIDIDVVRDNIDMLSMSAHKFFGPKAIGALYCRKGIRLATLIHGGAGEFNKRAGTINVAMTSSMAVALKDAVDNLEKNQKYISNLRDHLIEGLSKIEHVRLNGDRVKRLPGNVNFCFEGIEGEGLLLLLDDKGIRASSGSACTSKDLSPSHVLMALGLPHEVVHGSLRVSLCEHNTIEEMDYIVESVKEVVEYLRSISPLWHDLKQGVQEHVI